MFPVSEYDVCAPKIFKIPEQPVLGVDDLGFFKGLKDVFLQVSVSS